MIFTLSEEDCAERCRAWLGGAAFAREGKMGLELPWSLVDIPMDARMQPQTAARREGLSIGEWLTRRILKRDRS